MEQALSALEEAKYFSKLNLTVGIFQVPLGEESGPMTASSTQKGQYQFSRMPMEATLSTSVSQSKMLELMQE
jgi:hypothetical protein